MDLATLVGMIGATGIIVASIVLGGSAGIFINVPSILVVCGGTFMAAMVKFNMGDFFGAFKMVGRAFKFQGVDPVGIIKQIVELANLARKEGLLALEGFEVDSDFMQKGIQLVADGHEPDFVNKVLTQDISGQSARYTTSEDVWTSIADLAPAMGMIGTLIGLVQMLSNMDDPKAIGPAMAVALLTTLYGAFIANAVALPLKDKLKVRNIEEKMNKTLILQGLISIQEGLNPRVIEELLKTYLPESMRDQIGEES